MTFLYGNIIKGEIFADLCLRELELLLAKLVFVKSTIESFNYASEFPKSFI